MDALPGEQHGAEPIIRFRGPGVFWFIAIFGRACVKQLALIDGVPRTGHNEALVGWLQAWGLNPLLQMGRGFGLPSPAK
jgi:hypothetical protein